MSNWTGFLHELIFLWSSVKQIWNRAHYGLCVNCYYHHKVPMLKKSLQLCQPEVHSACLSLLPRFIFGTEARSPPWQTECVQNWKFPLPALGDFRNHRVLLTYGTQLPLFSVPFVRVKTVSVHAHPPVTILNITVLEGTAILIKRTV